MNRYLKKIVIWETSEKRYTIYNVTWYDISGDPLILNFAYKNTNGNGMDCRTTLRVCDFYKIQVLPQTPFRKNENDSVEVETSSAPIEELKNDL